MAGGRPALEGAIGSLLQRQSGSGELNAELNVVASADQG